jgi:hypothetical protein
MGFMIQTPELVSTRRSIVLIVSLQQVFPAKTVKISRVWNLDVALNLKNGKRRGHSDVKQKNGQTLRPDGSTDRLDRLVK